MRVNITYSVDLDDIPREIREKLSECLISLAGVQEILEGAVRGDPLQTIEDLENIRAKLLSTDLTLADCMNILSGYVSVKSKLATSQQEPIEVEGIGEGENETL